jgi:hypothetical protein
MSKLGFTYRDDLGYILPVASLIPESSWKEHIHFFKDSSDLRKSLCRDGIPIIVDGIDATSKPNTRARGDEDYILLEHDRKVLSGKNIEKIQRWVTFTHIPKEYKNSTFHGIAKLKDAGAFSL